MRLLRMFLPNLSRRYWEASPSLPAAVSVPPDDVLPDTAAAAPPGAAPGSVAAARCSSGPGVVDDPDQRRSRTIASSTAATAASLVFLDLWLVTFMSRGNAASLRS